MGSGFHVKVLGPGSQVKSPRGRVPSQGSQLEGPRSRVPCKDLGFRVPPMGPESRVPGEESQVEGPESRVLDPTFPVCRSGTLLKRGSGTGIFL